MVAIKCSISLFMIILRHVPQHHSRIVHHYWELYHGVVVDDLAGSSWCAFWWRVFARAIQSSSFLFQAFEFIAVGVVIGVVGQIVAVGFSFGNLLRDTLRRLVWLADGIRLGLDASCFDGFGVESRSLITLCYVSFFIF